MLSSCLGTTAVSPSQGGKDSGCARLPFRWSICPAPTPVSVWVLEAQEGLPSVR